VKKYAEEFGWKVITTANQKEIFMDMVKKMTMSHSYKPVFLLAFLDNIDGNGGAKLEDVARDFARFYEDRREKGLEPEKKNCIFTKKKTMIALMQRMADIFSIKTSAISIKDSWLLPIHIMTVMISELKSPMQTSLKEQRIC
jgi:hypothetical protein